MEATETGPQHTPGPYEICENQNGDLDICAPGAGDMLADLVGCPNAEANARLFASAPALLAALEAARPHINDGTHIYIDGAVLVGDDGPIWLEDEIDAAIAAARGIL